MAVLSSPANPNPDPNPSPIGPERWARAEKLTQNIILKVQPTTVSEEQRKKLIDYVRSLIRGYFDCEEVFSYGSVPLKTFLPDGDIDLTVFASPTWEDIMAKDIVFLLEKENQNKFAEFTIKDVRLISAEVKIVKCLVQNVVVDISFNQIGGICSLCFLEKVDNLIGKDHIFKRSIILIKAWCYYESRILGAHHGLISTYALETMILYIFHLFHSTLDGPLAVLYKFLDYFSKFDWDNYCISLNGPVRLSSLPGIVAEALENDGGDFLLSNDFIRYCVGKFSVPLGGVEMNSRAFQPKHFNIVDPLKENNNLGRSVNEGNSYRIRSAFAYGASKLGRILLQSEDTIADGLNNFFSNTLGRNGSTPNSFTPTLTVSDESSSETEAAKSRKKSGCPADSTGNCKVDPIGSSLDRVQKGNLSVHQSTPPTETKQCLKLSNDNSSSIASSTERSAPIVTKPIFAPHLFFTNSARNREMKKENCEEKHGDNVSSEIRQRSNEEKDLGKNLSNGFADLSGDYDYHLRCLQYGRWCYEHPYAVRIPQLPPPPPYQINYLSEQPPEFRRVGFPQMNSNGFIPRPAFYDPRPLLGPGPAYGFVKMPNPRGTGPHFPNKNPPPLGYRHSKGRNIRPQSRPTIDQSEIHSAVDPRQAASLTK